MHAGRQCLISISNHGTVNKPVSINQDFMFLYINIQSFPSISLTCESVFLHKCICAQVLRDYCGIYTRLASPFALPPPQMLSTSTSKPQTTSLYLTRCSIIKSQVKKKRKKSQSAMRIHSAVNLQYGFFCMQPAMHSVL